MHISLQNIVLSNYQWRLEFNFDINQVINFQSIHNNKISMFSTYTLHKYQQNKFNDNIIFIYTLENYNDIIEIYDEIKNNNWIRIKIKFYGNESIMTHNEIKKLKLLLYNFIEEWSKITEELKCILEWDVNTGLYNNFLDDWNECFILHNQKNIKLSII